MDDDLEIVHYIEYDDLSNRTVPSIGKTKTRWPYELIYIFSVNMFCLGNNIHALDILALLFHRFRPTLPTEHGKEKCLKKKMITVLGCQSTIEMLSEKLHSSFRQSGQGRWRNLLNFRTVPTPSIFPYLASVTKTYCQSISSRFQRIRMYVLSYRVPRISLCFSLHTYMHISISIYIYTNILYEIFAYPPFFRLLLLFLLRCNHTTVEQTKATSLCSIFRSRRFLRIPYIIYLPYTPFLRL